MQRLKRAWEGLLARRSGYDEAELTPQERAFANAWTHEFYARIRDAAAFAGLATAVVFTPLVLLTAELMRTPLLIMNVGASALLGLWLLGLRKAKWLNKDLYFLGIQTGVLILTAHMVRIALNEGTPTNVMLTSNLLLILSCYMVHLCPNPDWLAQVAGAYLLVGGLAMTGHPGQFRWILIEALALGSTLMLDVVRVRGLKMRAVSEFKIKRLTEVNARIKYEQEQAVATAMADAFPSVARTVSAGALEASVLQGKRDVLGGDWVGLRALGDGRIVAAVAGGLTKGVMAAMVAHAVQTLWAEAAAAEPFDPGAWLARVNATLLRLGRRKAHHVSLGLVLASETRVSYWSVGHPPLFVADADATRPKPEDVRRLEAAGDALGVTETVAIEERTLALPAEASVDVLLGSHGVFDPKSGLAPADVAAPIGKVNTQGAKALDDIPSHEDKILVRIRRRTTAKELATAS